MTSCVGLLELIEVRNIIVHKGGRADARFLRRCPWLRISSGDRLLVTEQMLHNYAHVVSYYLIEVIWRWVRVEGHDLSQITELLETQTKALSEIRSQAGTG
jgi:hypothetical protein